jgi:AcrR family transcriptional regulator
VNVNSQRGGKRLKLDTGIRRDQIAEAVVAVASAEGIERVSVAAVARHVGVVPSALYRHYPSKEAMLETTFDRLRLRLIANLERARAEAGDPLDAIHRALRLHVELFLETGGVALLFWTESFTRDRRRREALLELMSRYRGGLAALFGEAQAAGLVRRDVPAENAAVMFFGLFLPGAMLWRMSRGRFDLPDHAERAWTVFREGIAPPPPSKVRRPARRARAQETPR